MAQHRIMTILLFVCLSLCFEVAQSELKKDEDPCIYSDDCESRCCHRDSPNGSGKCVQKSSPSVRCYGPNNGDPCFHSHQCNSGCCILRGSLYNAVCVPKYDKTRQCLGPNIGDFCYSSDQCDNGCCYNWDTIGKVPICVKSGVDKCFGSDNADYCALNTLCKSGCCRGPTYAPTYKSGICRPKAAENEECDLEPVGGLYNYCPCESGLVCEKRTPRNMASLLKNLGKSSPLNKIKLLLKVTNRRICKKPNTANN
ncbi:keratin-associated protein 10-4-like isoform X2 [Eleutherodactylus coqui]|uniref:keratin-associated protein 10-4-like isoform X2 n=1 Tax=Eleutherodactylus coqui TaxID=57060 RepID=UPI003462F681